MFVPAAPRCDRSRWAARSGRQLCAASCPGVPTVSPLCPHSSTAPRRWDSPPALFITAGRGAVPHSQRGPSCAPCPRPFVGHRHGVVTDGAAVVTGGGAARGGGRGLRCRGGRDRISGATCADYRKWVNLRAAAGGSAGGGSWPGPRALGARSRGEPRPNLGCPRPTLGCPRFVPCCVVPRSSVLPIHRSAVRGRAAPRAPNDRRSPRHGAGYPQPSRRCPLRMRRACGCCQSSPKRPGSVQVVVPLWCAVTPAQGCPPRVGRDSGGSGRCVSWAVVAGSGAVLGPGSCSRGRMARRRCNRSAVPGVTGAGPAATGGISARRSCPAAGTGGAAAMRPRRGAAAGGCASPWGGGAARCRGAERGRGLGPGPPALPCSSGPRCPPHGRAVPAARGARCESRLPGDVRNVTVTHGRGDVGMLGGGPAAPSRGALPGGGGLRAARVRGCPSADSSEETAGCGRTAAMGRFLLCPGGDGEGGAEAVCHGGHRAHVPHVAHCHCAAGRPSPRCARGVRVAASSARGYGGRGGLGGRQCHRGREDTGPNRTETARPGNRERRGEAAGAGVPGSAGGGSEGGGTASVPPRNLGGVGGGSGDTQTRRAAAPPLRVTSGAAIARQEAPRVRGCGAASGTPRCHGSGAAPGGSGPRAGAALSPRCGLAGLRVSVRPSARSPGPPPVWAEDAGPDLAAPRGVGTRRRIPGSCAPRPALPGGLEEKAPEEEGGHGLPPRTAPAGAERGAGRPGPPVRGQLRTRGLRPRPPPRAPPAAVPPRGAPRGPEAPRVGTDARRPRAGGVRAASRPCGGGAGGR